MKLTLLLITINIFVFFFSLSNFDFYLTNFGFSIDNLLSGKIYVLVTSMFLHASFLHLAGNMIALFLLGWTIEKNVSKWKYILVYFVSGILGNLAAFIPIFGYDSSTIAVGASAAISGLVGMGIFVCPGKMVIFPSIIPLPFVLAGAIYFLSNLSNLFEISNIGYPAHILGMMTGAMFGLIWGENRIKRLFLFVFLLILVLTLPLIIDYIFA
jgi:rhomboid protease GluP